MNSDETERRLADVAATLADGDAALHPDVERYVDGTASQDERKRIEQHLAFCGICREDVADLRAMRTQIAQPAVRWWPLATAAAAAAIVAGVLLWQGTQRNAPPSRPRVIRTTPIDYGRGDWNTLVKQALESGTLEVPRSRLAELREGPAELRGSTNAPLPHVEPSGITIETARPQFKWPAIAGASYRVGVYRSGAVVLRSPLLQEPSWIPDRDLPRDATYSWDVSARRPNGEESIIPAPPAPIARFHVLSEREASDLAGARSRFASDPLLLGLLYAHSGMQSEAETELRRYADAHPESRAARKLAEAAASAK